MEKCPQCKAELKKVRFDVGYGIDVESLHCEKCGFNITEDKLIKKRINDIESGKIKGKTEKELNDYLKSRGVNIL